MTFKESVSGCLKKYLVIKGRAPRSEYWWFQLFIFILMAGGFLLALICESEALLVCLVLVLIILIPPSITVAIRRLHDFNHSGWWYLVVLVPYLGSVAPFVFGLIKGTNGPNNFGEDPLVAFNNNTPQNPYGPGPYPFASDSGTTCASESQTNMSCDSLSQDWQSRFDLNKHNSPSSKIDLEKR